METQPAAGGDTPALGGDTPVSGRDTAAPGGDTPASGWEKEQSWRPKGVLIVSVKVYPGNA